jgi:hypothetical protein
MKRRPAPRRRRRTRRPSPRRREGGRGRDQGPPDRPAGGAGRITSPSTRSADKVYYLRQAGPRWRRGRPREAKYAARLQPEGQEGDRTRRGGVLRHHGRREEDAGRRSKEGLRDHRPAHGKDRGEGQALIRRARDDARPARRVGADLRRVLAPDAGLLLLADDERGRLAGDAGQVRRPGALRADAVRPHLPDRGADRGDPQRAHLRRRRRRVRWPRGSPTGPPGRRAVARPPEPRLPRRQASSAARTGQIRPSARP